MSGKPMRNLISCEELGLRLSRGEEQISIARSLGVKVQDLQYRRKKWGMPKLKAAVREPHCQISGCPNEVHGRGLCNLHYKRKAIHGEPLARIIRESGEGTPHIDGYWVHKINGKQVLRHRIAAEKKIGRPLLPGEEVHHKDFNRGNDDPENLVVCANRKEHKAYHSGPRKEKANVIHA